MHGNVKTAICLSTVVHRRKQKVNAYSYREPLLRPLRNNRRNSEADEPVSFDLKHVALLSHRLRHFINFETMFSVLRYCRTHIISRRLDDCLAVFIISHHNRVSSDALLQKISSCRSRENVNVPLARVRFASRAHVTLYEKIRFCLDEIETFSVEGWLSFTRNLFCRGRKARSHIHSTQLLQQGAKK